MLDRDLIKTGWRCLCPRCRGASLYEGVFSFDVREFCPVCGLDLRRSDSADGPAVFLIFVLGFAVVPLALALEVIVHPPLWVQLALWTPVVLTVTLGVLRPLKAYIIALQFKHSPQDWR